VACARGRTDGVGPAQWAAVPGANAGANASLVGKLSEAASEVVELQAAREAQVGLLTTHCDLAVKGWSACR
jgi:hypothetical protein